MEIHTRLPRGRILRLTTNPEPTALTSRRLLTAATGGGGIVLGAFAAYLLDPRLGRRRRHVVRDKAAHYVRETADVATSAGRDLQNRREGWAHRRSGVTGEPALEQRVRAEIGKLSSRPDAVTVRAEGGRITVAGPVWRDEAEAIRAALTCLPEVAMIEDRLEIQEDNDAAEGEKHIEAAVHAVEAHREGRRHPRRWSPAKRLMMAGAGSGLAVYGARRHGAARLGLGSSGAILVARAVANRPPSRARARRCHMQSRTS